MGMFDFATAMNNREAWWLKTVLMWFNTLVKEEYERPVPRGEGCDTEWCGERMSVMLKAFLQHHTDVVGVLAASVR